MKLAGNAGTRTSNFCFRDRRVSTTLIPNDKMAGAVGIAPTSTRFKGEHNRLLYDTPINALQCAALNLWHYVKVEFTTFERHWTSTSAKWWARSGSDGRPLRFQCSALTILSYMPIRWWGPLESNQLLLFFRQTWEPSSPDPHSLTFQSFSLDGMYSTCLTQVQLLVATLPWVNYTCEWQFGQINLKFSCRSSCQFRLIWSISNTNFLLFHVSPRPHLQQTCGNPRSIRARRR